MNNSDREIVFDDIYIQKYSMLVRYCGQTVDRDAAEDIVNDAFLLLYGNWDSFDNHREQTVCSWLYEALNLKCREYRRRKFGRTHGTVYDSETLLRDMPDTSSDLLAEEGKYRAYIEEIRKRLSPTELSVFECIAEKNMDYGQAAAVLGISPGTVRVRWLRTRKHIGKFIGRVLY